MKREKVLKKLKEHYEEKKYVRLTREKRGFVGISTGFIVGVSDDFVLLQESENFRVLGYQIFPIKTIKHVRFNKNDKTVHRILEGENSLSEVKEKYKIDLTSWNSIVNDLKSIGLTIISECEHPKHKYFCIGNLEKVNKKSIEIRYFNGEGIIDNKLTKNKFKNITKLSFDDHYANIFSKYIIEQD